MKKKDLKPIKKISFGNKRKKINRRRSKMIRMKKYTLMLFLRAESILKLRKIYLKKHIFIQRYFNFFQFLIFKKEFFFFKHFFLKFQLHNDINILMYPHFVFEKQFLFKFGEYQNFLFEFVNNSMFLKKNYNFSINPGLEYLVGVNNMIDNPDPKDPIFYIKELFSLQNSDFYNFDNTVNFSLNLNCNVFFFILVDIYKILIFLQFQNSIN